MAKVCISGYYGYDSIGNELVLMSMVNALRRQSENMEIVVFSGNPTKTEEDFDVIAVDRDNWNMVKSELKTADLLISGGGHLLREDANMDVLKYYLKVIKTALRCKKPVFVFNQVIGPLTSSRAKNMVAKVMQKVQKITVADQDSADLLHSMGIRRGRIHMVEDPVLAMTDFETEWNLTHIVQPEEKPVARPFAKKQEHEESPAINYDGMEVEIEIRIVEPEPTAEPAIGSAQGTEVTGDTIEIVSASQAKADEDLALAAAAAEASAENVVEVTPEIAAKIAATAGEKAGELAPAEEMKQDTAATAAAEIIEEMTEEAVAEAVAEIPAATGKTNKKPVKPGKKTGNRPHNLGLVVPSFWKKPGEKFVAFTVSARTDLPVTQVTAMADYMVEQGYEVVFLPVNYPDDVLLAKEIIAMMKNPAYEVDAKMSPQSLLTAIGEVDFVFSSEIYPMMLAAVCKKPFASLCNSNRALDFVTGLGLTPTGNLLAYDGEAFIRNFKAAVANPEVIVSAIETNLPDLQEKAEYGMGLLQILFEQIQRKKHRAERGSAGRAQDRQTERRTTQARSIVGGKEEESLPQNEEAGVVLEDVVTLSAEDCKKEPAAEKTPVEAAETEKEA
ncbi:Polysaccharide pyruvyl transferase [anaerobic digester metagenome]